jgi:hypothetical protein
VSGELLLMNDFVIKQEYNLFVGLLLAYHFYFQNHQSEIKKLDIY